jgi:septal ring factor EnvC (AmiA/AmiB activator)
MTWRTYFDPVPDQTLRDYYESNFGHADEISHFLGWVQHRNFYYTQNSWANFINSLFLNTFPFSTARDLLIGVVAAVYSWGAQGMYNRGVDQGRQIIGKINETITWAQDQINSAVNDMRNRIDTEIVDPVRQKANQIGNDLKAAQSTLSDMGVSIDGFKTDINNMKGNIAFFDYSIKAFDNKLTSFDSKLKGFDSTTSNLQAQLKDAQNKLNQFKTLIDDLTRRVNNLEGKKPQGLEFLKNLEVGMTK